MKTRTTLKVASLLFISLMLGCSQTHTEVKAPKPVKVKTVETHSSENSVRYSASIRPATQVDMAFKVGGYIDAIAQQKDSAGQWRNLQAGDIVRKGTVLARVRQSDYMARVNEAKSQHGEARSALETNNSQLMEATAAVETARAQLNDAQASFDRTNLDYERARILFSTQSITKPDYDAAKAQYEIAQAKLDAARSQLKSAEARVAISRAQIGAAESRIKTAEATTLSATIPLQDTQLRAPMTAVVIDRKIEIGSLVSQGATGFVLADLTYVKAAFGVPDLALQSLQLGDTLKLTTDALPGIEFSGHISRIAPSADQNSRVFDVEVTIPNPDGRLKPGMIASLNVNEGARAKVSVPVVPLTAVTRSQEDPNAYAVLVVEERDGKQYARLRTVTLGESFGNAIVVTGGVRAGEMVVTTGVTQVADGEVVQVIPMKEGL
jgi:RND family efflux transporter MFP subunit